MPLIRSLLKLHKSLKRATKREPESDSKLRLEVWVSYGSKWSHRIMRLSPKQVFQGILKPYVLSKLTPSVRPMSKHYDPSVILKLICGVYAYMMLMASANVANCEARRERACADQWTQAFTVSGGAATTLWAYITDNPTQDAKKQPSRPRRSSSRRSTPVPTGESAKPGRSRRSEDEAS